MKLYETLRIADGTPKPTSFDRLVTAWNRSSDDERQRFLSHVGATAPHKPQAHFRCHRRGARQGETLG
jgi:hypothetical protein